MKYLLLILLLSCTNEQPDLSYLPKQIEYVGFQIELLNELNLVRGERVLKPELLLTNIAMQKAIEMENLNSLSHNGFSQRSEISNTVMFAEVLNKNMVTAKSYISAFMNSREHRKAILGNYTHCGIYEYKGYLCINFGSY